MSGITEIHIDLHDIFGQAVRRTLDVVKATPEATPDQHGLSVDELDWAMDQMQQARTQIAITLNRLSKDIHCCPQAEEDGCGGLTFRVICQTAIQAGLLPDAVKQYFVACIAAAWFRLHPELKTSIDTDAELRKLNRITLLSTGVERPYRM